MSAHESEGRLWDPEAELGGEHDELVGRLEHVLAPLHAPAPPALEFPARETRVDERASPSRGWIVAVVSLAAALALWFAWRAQPTPPAGSSIAQAPPSSPAPSLAPVPDVWRVEALEGESHCQPAELPTEGEQAPPELDEGAALEQGASLQLGEGASARLSSGEARVELHPSSLVHNEQGVLHLSEGRAWVDLPARATEVRWRLLADALALETRAARFMVTVERGQHVEIEVVSGELELEGDEGRAEVRAGQLCRARFGAGPLELLGPLECETP